MQHEIPQILNVDQNTKWKYTNKAVHIHSYIQVYTVGGEEDDGNQANTTACRGQSLLLKCVTTYSLIAYSLLHILQQLNTAPVYRGVRRVS